MKFVIKWMYYGQVFIGVGFIFGKEYTGITIGNLFIGIENTEIPELGSAKNIILKRNK